MHYALAPLLALVSAAAPAEQDIELYDYTVKKGDTCSSIAKREFGSRKAYNKIHKHNPSMGATPHKLKAGTILKLPREVKKPDARVTATERQVEARAPKDKDWSRAGQGFELFRGWRVSTLDAAFAEVTFKDTSRIYMRENTLVIIYGGTDGATRRTGTTAKLNKGALRSKLGELSGGKTLAVETPSGSTALEGGDALITVDDSGTSRVANHGGGKATVKSKSGKKVVVPELTGSKVKKGKPPTPPKPLPATPKWAADNASSFVIPAGSTGSVTASWGGVAKAETYRVEVGRLKKGGFVMTSVVVPKTATSFEVHGLEAGEYFATVAAVDNDLFESPPSRLFETSVIGATLQDFTGAAITVPAAAEGQPTAAVQVLPGARLQSPAGLTCGLGDAQPAAEVIVTGTGTQRVSCKDAKGNLAPGFEVEVVELKIANSDGGQQNFEIPRAKATTLQLSVAADVTLPEGLTVTAPANFDVGALTKDSEGAWSLTVTANEGAANVANFKLVAGDSAIELGTFVVNVKDAPVEVAKAPEPVDEDRNMVEVGVYGGFIKVSDSHELVTTDAPLARDRDLQTISPDFGVRFGFYPSRFFGIELEGGLMPTKLKEGSRAMLFESRASLIGQLPYRITPYLLVGGGITGLTSDAEVLGDDTDASFHFGGGLKFFATKHLAVRVGLRDVVLSAMDPIGASHSPQVLVGISGVFRRRSAKAIK